MSTNDQLILVDENDQAIGSEEKLLAHQKGLLHRAFSIFVFYQHEKTTELLLQQRQFEKYHCAGLWSNTCCSHPRPGETTEAAAKRRLPEEMGIEVDLKEVGGFHYKVQLDNGLTENEMDHVLIGFTQEKELTFNPDEVNAIRWITIPDLLQELIEQPKKFTPWLAPALEIALRSLA